MGETPNPGLSGLRSGLLRRGCAGKFPFPTRTSGTGRAFSVHARGVTVTGSVNVRRPPPAITFTLIVPDWTILPLQSATSLFPALVNVDRPSVNLQFESVAPAGRF